MDLFGTRGGRMASGVEALFIKHRVAVLKMAAQDPQVHGPAVAGKTSVFVIMWPARVVEANASGFPFRLQFASNARAIPVLVRVGHE